MAVKHQDAEAATEWPSSAFIATEGQFANGGCDEDHHESHRRGASGRWHCTGRRDAGRCGCACGYRIARTCCLSRALLRAAALLCLWALCMPPADLLWPQILGTRLVWLAPGAPLPSLVARGGEGFGPARCALPATRGGAGRARPPVAPSSQPAAAREGSHSPSSFGPFDWLQGPQDVTRFAKPFE